MVLDENIRITDTEYDSFADKNPVDRVLLGLKPILCDGYECFKYFLENIRCKNIVLCTDE